MISMYSKVKLEWGYNVMYLLIRKVVCLYFFIYFVYLFCLLDFLTLHLFPMIGNQTHLALNISVAFFWFSPFRTICAPNIKHFGTKKPLVHHLHIWMTFYIDYLQCKQKKNQLDHHWIDSMFQIFIFGILSSLLSLGVQLKPCEKLWPMIGKLINIKCITIANHYLSH
jgi:hypothetical protein